MQFICSRHRRNAIQAAVLGLFNTWAVAQEAPPQAQRPAVEITPAVSASVQGIRSEGDTLPGQVPMGRDTLLQFNAALGMRVQGRLLQGNLNYAAQAFRYQEMEQANRVTHAINGQGRMTVMEDHAFVEAAISRAEGGQSAFGASAQVASLANANRVEVTNASVSPVLTGRILQTVDLSARYTHAISEVSRPAFVPAGAPTPPTPGRLTTDTLDLSLAGGARLGWRLNAKDTIRRASQGRDIETSSVNGTLTYAADVDVALRAGVGVEDNNVLSNAFQTTRTGLLGVRWTPTPRTVLDAEASERYFGRGHAFSLQHRMERTLVRFSDSRQVGNQLGGGAAVPGQATTLLEELLRGGALRTSGTAAEREQAILDGLRAAGIDPAQTVQPNSLNTTPSVNRRQELFLGYSGLRLSLSASGFTGQAQRLGNPLNPFEDLALTPVVRQAGFNASLGWRLGPSSSVSATVQATRTPRTGTLPGVEFQSAGLAYTKAMGRRATFGLSVQQVEQTTLTSTTRLQRTTQVVGATLNMRF